MTKRVALAWGLLLLNAGCAHGALVQTSPDVPQMANSAGERPLEADVLRSLLTDVTVTPVQSADVITDHPPGELFLSGGSYERIVGRARRYGRFDIRGNSVCVRGDNFSEQCRQVLALPNGTYLFIDTSDDSEMSVNITPYR